MATWTIACDADPALSGSANSDLDGIASLDESNKPGDFDANAVVNSVRFVHRITGSGISDDTWDVGTSALVLVDSTGGDVASVTPAADTGNGNETSVSDITDSSPASTDGGDYQGTLTLATTAGASRTWATYRNTGMPDGGSMVLEGGVAETFVVIDYDPVVATDGTAAITEAGDSVNGDGGVEISGTSGGPGGVGYLELQAVNDEYALTSDKAALDILGDIDVIACIEEANGFVPGIVEQTILAKRDSASRASQSYRFYLFDTPGAGDYGPGFEWGNSAGLVTAAADITGVITGSHIWIRAILDVDNGSTEHDVYFYYSNDPINTAVGSVSWTLLETATTTAGTTSIPNTTSPLTLGVYDHDGTPAAEFDGKIYGVWIYDGIPTTPGDPPSGTLAANPDFRDADQGWDSPPGTDDNSNSWSLNNGAAWISGSSDTITEASDSVNGDGTVTGEISGTAAITEASDTVAATGNLETSGIAAITEASDTGAGVGDVPLDGSAAVTEASDIVAGAGNVGVSGTAAVTEASDTVAGSGDVPFTGSAAITEASDTVAGAGDVDISGTAAVTEASDTVAGVGDVPLDGSAAVTEASDIVAAQGGSQISGTAAITETSDTVAGAGDVDISGTAAATETSDTVAGAGGVEISGSAAITEGGPVGDPTHEEILGDVVAATGSVPANINGTAAATEASDSVSGVGDVPLDGTAAIAELTDTVAASGDIDVSGTAAITETSDTVAGVGNVGVTDISGTAAVSEASDTVAAAGDIDISGTAAISEASDTVAGVGDLDIAGTAAITETSDAVAGAGDIGSAPTDGTAAITEASDTVAGVGDVPLDGSAAVAEASDTVAGVGDIPISGTAAIAEASDTVAASGGASTSGTAAISETSDTVAASGDIETNGTAAVTELADAVAAAGGVEIAGQGLVTEISDALAAVGSVEITGSAAIVEASDIAAGLQTVPYFAIDSSGAPVGQIDGTSTALTVDTAGSVLLLEGG